MKRALSELTWYREPTQALDDSNPPFFKWFADGELNASVNCLDRHLAAGGGDKTAYIWVGEPGDERVISYRELHDEVNRLANVLHDLGVRKGDRVAIYLGMVPELPMALLACARIGAAHSVVFGGFSAQSLAGRINDAECKVLITADGGWRKGAIVPLKQAADDALVDCPTIEHVLVVRRTEHEVTWFEGRDHWYHDLVPAARDWCEPERMNAEDLLFLLYTSGTTAKPKGIVHTTAGYLLGTKFTHELVFDIRDDDVYWCTADIGWVTGHSYIVYGPLQNHTTGVLYEGAPEHPSWSRHWEIVQKHKVTIYYTAPTAIRALVGAGDGHLEGYDLSSLRLLGTVGEPINPEAWMWYHDRVGGGRCPIVDTWWQTETGSILIAPLPGVIPTKPGSATVPLPGIVAEIVNEQGETEPRGGGGYLVLKRPWPSMLRTFYGEDERYVETYWSRFGPRVYFTGDGAKTDEDGYFWLLGRVDDVINVAGPPHLDHRGRVRARLAPGGRRGRGDRRPRRAQGRGHRRVRDHDRERRERGPARRAARARGDLDRQDRAPVAAALHARPPEDAQRQDHAPPAQGHRGGARARRRDDPARSRDRAGDQAERRRPARALREGDGPRPRARSRRPRRAASPRRRARRPRAAARPPRRAGGWPAPRSTRGSPAGRRARP